MIYWHTGRSSELNNTTMSSTGPKYRFESVPGYFMQDEPETDPYTFDYVRQTNQPIHDPGPNLTEHPTRQNTTSASYLAHTPKPHHQLHQAPKRNGKNSPPTSKP